MIPVHSSMYTVCCFSLLSNIQGMAPLTHIFLSSLPVMDTQTATKSPHQTLVRLCTHPSGSV